MTLSESDSFKPRKLRAHVRTVCQCMCEPISAGRRKKNLSALIRELQNGTDHLPLLSYQCAVNCLSEAKQGGLCLVCVSLFCLFVGFFFSPLTHVTVQYGAGSVPGIVHPVSPQSIIQIIYLNDGNKRTWQQLIQTTLHRDSSTERWRGKIEGRADKWREREVGWAWHADSVFCESYRGQGRSRSPVMLDGLQWGVSDAVKSFWSACMQLCMHACLKVTHQNAVCVCTCIP